MYHIMGVFDIGGGRMGEFNFSGESIKFQKTCSSLPGEHSVSGIDRESKHLGVWMAISSNTGVHTRYVLV